MNKNIFILLIVCFYSINQVHLFASEAKFPLRSKYTNVSTISHNELYLKLNQFLIVDVRSRLEYNTLHIMNAIHVSGSDKGFISKLKKIRKTDITPIVFYCNGITCEKSYKAYEKAKKYNISKILVFDLGVLGWTLKYPYSSVLLGKTPVFPKDILSQEKFLKHNISPSEFVKKISERTMVVDIREPVQKNMIILEKVSRSIPSDRFRKLLQKAKKNKKTLLIYDSVGKQIRWLQYLLEEEDFKNYYFMQGGVKEYLAEGID